MILACMAWKWVVYYESAKYRFFDFIELRSSCYRLSMIIDAPSWPPPLNAGEEFDAMLILFFTLSQNFYKKNLTIFRGVRKNLVFSHFWGVRGGSKNVVFWPFSGVFGRVARANFFLVTRFHRKFRQKKGFPEWSLARRGGTPRTRFWGKNRDGSLKSGGPSTRRDFFKNPRLGYSRDRAH